MKTIVTDVMKAKINNIFNEILNMYEEGYQIWFNFSPHVKQHISVFYFNSHNDICSEYFSFEELDLVLEFIKNNKKDIFNNFELC